MILTELDSPKGRLIDMRRLRLFVAAAASVAILAACGSGDDDTTAVPEDDNGESSEAPPDAPLLGTYWGLDGVDVADVTADPPPDTSAYVLIEEGNVEGQTGCNSFGGNAEVSEDNATVSFSQVIATKRGCSGDLGEMDQAMLSVLRGEVTAEVSGDTLTLTNAEGGTLELTVMEEPPADE